MNKSILLFYGLMVFSSLIRAEGFSGSEGPGFIEMYQIAETISVDNGLDVGYSDAKQIETVVANVQASGVINSVAAEVAGSATERHHAVKEMVVVHHVPEAVNHNASNASNASNAVVVSDGVSTSGQVHHNATTPAEGVVTSATQALQNTVATVVVVTENTGTEVRLR